MDKDASKKALIATRLREAREMAGLSQAQVAKLLGLHRPSVSEAEAGKRSVTAEEISKLAEIYDVDVQWLLGEDANDVNVQRDRAILAARELEKLKPEDLSRLMNLLRSMRQDGGNS